MIHLAFVLAVALTFVLASVLALTFASALALTFASVLVLAVAFEAGLHLILPPFHCCFRSQPGSPFHLR